jgi:hypothetical protein
MASSKARNRRIILGGTRREISIRPVIACGHLDVLEALVHPRQSMETDAG